MPQCRPGCESGQSTNHPAKYTLRAAYQVPFDWESRPHPILAEQLACSKSCLLSMLALPPYFNLQRQRHKRAPTIQHSFLHHVSSVPASHRCARFTRRLEGNCVRPRKDSVFHGSRIPCSKPFSSRILRSFILCHPYRLSPPVSSTF
jgi:hypothetical protein